MSTGAEQLRERCRTDRISINPLKLDEIAFKQKLKANQLRSLSDPGNISEIALGGQITTSAVFAQPEYCLELELWNQKNLGDIWMRPNSWKSWLHILLICKRIDKAIALTSFMFSSRKAQLIIILNTQTIPQTSTTLLKFSSCITERFSGILKGMYTTIDESWAPYLYVQPTKYTYSNIESYATFIAKLDCKARYR
jgi:hypothetical protein